MRRLFRNSSNACSARLDSLLAHLDLALHALGSNLEEFVHIERSFTVSSVHAGGSTPRSRCALSLGYIWRWADFKR
eukprot:2018750-Pleurochrysis_carterae.AAC.2